MLLLLVLALFSSAVSQLVSCTQQWQCESVSTDYNYVSCVSGQCQCNFNRGFAGNATSQYPCQCPTQYSVYWQGGLAYCINYQDAVAWKNTQAQDNLQLSIVEEVYQSLIWPTPIYIIEALIAGVPTPVSNLFAVDSIGRVDPAGVFATQDGLVEYFYGAVWTGGDRVSNITFRKLTVTNSVVSLTVDLTFAQYYGNTLLYYYNLTQSGTFSFNSQNTIQSVDLIIHNLGAAPHLYVNPTTQCDIILYSAKCNSTYDPLGYYTNFTDCVNYFTNIYEVGTWDNFYFDGNNTICRLYHSILAIARPEVHCPHAGKTGGGVCVPHLYQSYYDGTPY